MVDHLLAELIYSEIFSISRGFVLITTHHSDVDANLKCYLSRHNPVFQFLDGLRWNLNLKEASCFMRYHLQLLHPLVESHANKWIHQLFSRYCIFQNTLNPRRIIQIANLLRLKQNEQCVLPNLSAVSSDSDLESLKVLSNSSEEKEAKKASQAMASSISLKRLFYENMSLFDRLDAVAPSSDVHAASLDIMFSKLLESAAASVRHFLARLIVCALCTISSPKDAPRLLSCVYEGKWSRSIDFCPSLFFLEHKLEWCRKTDNILREAGFLAGNGTLHCDPQKVLEYCVSQHQQNNKNFSNYYSIIQQLESVLAHLLFESDHPCHLGLAALLEVVLLYLPVQYPCKKITIIPSKPLRSPLSVVMGPDSLVNRLKEWLEIGRLHFKTEALYWHLLACMHLANGYACHNYNTSLAGSVDAAFLPFFPSNVTDLVSQYAEYQRSDLLKAVVYIGTIGVKLLMS